MQRMQIAVAGMLAAAIFLSGCISERDPFPTLVESPTPAPALVGATGVELIVFPDDDTSVLLDRVSAARKRVYVTIYLLTDTRVVDALKRAVANGADVRVLIEAEPFGAAATAKAAIERLNRAGIVYKTANPIFRLTHQKTFVIDDQVVILTANMTKSSFTRNREFGVVHADERDVEEIARAFDADWTRGAFEPRSAVLGWSPVNARQRIDTVIRSAQRTLTIYAASAKDDAQIALIAAARKRGVDVRVLTSPPRDVDGGEPELPDLDLLQRSGVKVRYLKSPYVHAKTFTADGNLAFIGSINMTAQSLDFNRELGILVSDPDALARLNATFEADWAKATDR